MSKNLIIDLNNYSTDKNVISLLLFIENNSDLLRKQYLKFISNIGRKKINDLSVIELFQFDNRLSIWWMSQLNEKSFLKNDSIQNFIKFLAVKEILNRNKKSKK